jgi:hypothetical protein
MQITQQGDGLFAGPPPGWFARSLGRIYSPENLARVTAGEVVTREVAERELRHLDQVETDAAEIAAFASWDSPWRIYVHHGSAVLCDEHAQDRVARAVLGASESILAPSPSEGAQAVLCALSRLGLRPEVVREERRRDVFTFLRLATREKGGRDWLAERRAFWTALL